VANDYAASLVADDPARFGLLAALPLHDPGETVREVGRAVNELGADGLVLPTTRARRHQIGCQRPGGRRPDQLNMSADVAGDHQWSGVDIGKARTSELAH